MPLRWFSINLTGRPLRRAARLLAAVVFLGLTGAAAGAGGGAAEPALAQVVHGSGYSATVLGWTSWYGSYGLGGLGWGWCIDHGIAAPDAAFGYRPVDIADAAPATKAAMAWAVTSNLFADRIGAAATMLVLHDLMGATYPFGRLDVDRLTVANLGGFGGDEAAVLARARRTKADALAHRALRAPLVLHLEVAPAPSGGTLRLRLTDAGGIPIPDAVIEVSATGATLAATLARTGTDGTAAVGYTAGAVALSFDATATAADPTLHVLAPTGARAQRIAQPALTRVAAHLALAPPATTTPPTTTPPTTRPLTTTTTRLATTTTTTRLPSTTTTAPPTTTTRAPTTTTRPPTTTTTRPPTTTTTTARPPGTVPPTLPPQSAPSTTAPPTTTPSTTAPPSTSPPTTSPPPATSPPAPSPPPPAAPGGPTTGLLPRTGAQIRGTLLLAAGLLLAGGALVGAGRHLRPPPR